MEVSGKRFIPASKFQSHIFVPCGENRTLLLIGSFSFALLFVCGLVFILFSELFLSKLNDEVLNIKRALHKRRLAKL